MEAVSIDAVVEKGCHAVTREELRERIVQFEEVLKQLPQIDIPVNHYFASGVYVRELRIPKNTLMTGSIYKEPHVHMVLQGEMTVVTEEGLKRVSAPCIFVAPPGTKRAGYAHEDTIWAAAFKTDETDPEKIMAAVTTEEVL